MFPIKSHGFGSTPHLCCFPQGPFVAPPMAPPWLPCHVGLEAGLCGLQRQQQPPRQAIDAAEGRPGGALLLPLHLHQGRGTGRSTGMARQVSKWEDL